MRRSSNLGDMDAPLVREATPDDVAAIVTMVRELAEFEKLAHECEISEATLSRSLFGESPAVFAHVAVAHDGTVAGMAIWFLTYSTFQGRHGIYLEDLIVRPELRGQGFGTALLRRLAAVAAERGYGRFEWVALDWNEPAIRFYETLGAQRMPEWLRFRLSGDALEAIASSN
jgi:GNAT superfamily N-acetyltransferase